MNENTIEVSKDEYKSILELACKAALLKEAVLDSATLNVVYENELYFGGGTEVATIFRYCFPFEYARKLRELKKAEEEKEGANDER